MNKINLQSITKAEKGTAEKYWFENEHIGLKRTLFHRVYIPLTPFNSGLEYEEQPVETTIVIEWLNLKLKNPDDLHNLHLKNAPEDETEVSVYIGDVHNPCDILSMHWAKTSGNEYRVYAELMIDFEYEGVAQNEYFNFETTVELNTKTKNTY